MHGEIVSGRGSRQEGAMADSATSLLDCQAASIAYLALIVGLPRLQLKLILVYFPVWYKQGHIMLPMLLAMASMFSLDQRLMEKSMLLWYDRKCSEDVLNTQWYSNDNVAANML